MIIDRRTYFNLIVFMIIISSFLPLLFNNLPPVVRSHHIWTTIWFLSIFSFYREILNTRLMLTIIFYGLLITIGINTFWKNIDIWNVKMLYTEFYAISIGASIYTYYIISRDYYSFAKITKLTLIFIFITSIMTIFSSFLNPMYAREIVGIDAIDVGSKKEALLSIKRFGGGGYGTAISLMCIIPIFVYFFKGGNFFIRKGNLFIYLTISFLALFNMQIFANIMIAIFFFIIAFIDINKIKKFSIIFIIIFSVISIVPKESYVKLFLNISELFDPNSEINYKFRDLSLFIETGASFEDSETGTGGRAGRYPMLFDSFIKQPFMGCFFYSDENGNGYLNEFIVIGNSGQVAGTHLHWMNKLTITGILGILIFFSILYVFFKSAIKNVQSDFKYYFVLSFIAFITYGLMKTISGREAWYTLFIVLPGMNYISLLKRRSKTIRY